MTLLILHPVHILLVLFCVFFVLFNWRGAKP
jgi:hypothetical protein